MIKLNLGCGDKILDGYINCDNWSTKEASEEQYKKVMHIDLADGLHEFEDESIDEILMNHVLEHIPDLNYFIRGVHRILKPGGVFHGEVPYGMSYASFSNWQHCHYFFPPCFTQMARDFSFICTQAEPVRVPINNWKWKIRNMIPARLMEMSIGWNAYDNIKFTLIKK